MKYYELNATQLAPVGIPINEGGSVEPRGFLNDFFLRGFENYLNLFFDVEDGTLKTDYAKSCAAPVTSIACEYCTNAQLQEAIGEWGFAYYSANDHDVNAHFLHALYAIPWGTPEWTTAIARYAANSNSVETTITYKPTLPYEYDLTINGDLASGGVSVSTMLTRIVENLGKLGTAHTQLDGLTATDEGTEKHVYAGCVSHDVAFDCGSASFPLPDVNINGGVGSYGYGNELRYYSEGVSGVAFDPGQTRDDFLMPGWESKAEFSDTVTYAIARVMPAVSTVWSAPTWWSVVNVNGFIGFRNNLNSTTVEIKSFLLAVCPGKDIPIVKVKQTGTNYEYNAFRWCGLYYVADRVHTDWVEDLSSIGYEISLPLVQITDVWSQNLNNWLQVDATTQVPVDALSGNLGYKQGTLSVYPNYDSTCKYAIIEWQNVSGTTAGRAEFEVVPTDGGKICVKNVSYSALMFLQARIAVCDSADVDVVIVYNAQREAFNAFTTRGFYYVLDGTHTEWTEDLSAIGYTAATELWTSSSRLKTAIVRNVWYTLYNSDGTAATEIPGTLIGYYRDYRDTLITNDISVFSFAIQDGVVKVKSSVNKLRMISFVFAI